MSGGGKRHDVAKRRYIRTLDGADLFKTLSAYEDLKFEHPGVMDMRRRLFPYLMEADGAVWQQPQMPSEVAGGGGG